MSKTTFNDGYLVPSFKNPALRGPSYYSSLKMIGLLSCQALRWGLSMQPLSPHVFAAILGVDFHHISSLSFLSRWQPRLASLLLRWPPTQDNLPRLGDDLYTLIMECFPEEQVRVLLCTAVNCLSYCT